MENRSQARRYIDYAAVLATGISYALMWPAYQALIKKNPEQEGGLIFAVVIVIASAFIWIWGRFWMPFVGKNLEKNLGKFAQSKFFGKGGWQLKFIQVCFENVPPFLVVIAHLLLIIVFLIWITIP